MAPSCNSRVSVRMCRTEVWSGLVRMLKYDDALCIFPACFRRLEEMRMADELQDCRASAGEEKGTSGF